MSDSENNQNGTGEENNQNGSSDTDSKLTALKDENQGLKAQLKEINDKFKNIDPDEFFATKQALKEKELEAAKSKGEEALREEIEKQLREDYQKKFDDLTSERDTYKSENFKLSVVDAAMSKIGSRFGDDVQDIVRELISKNVSRDDQGLYIKDKDGKPRFKSPNERMDLEDYFNEIADEKKSLVKSDWKGGARHGGEKSTAANNASSTAKIPDNIKNDYNALLKFFKSNPDYKLAAKLSGNGKGQSSADSD